jgi:hypothetical protein
VCDTCAFIHLEPPRGSKLASYHRQKRAKNCWQPLNQPIGRQLAEPWAEHRNTETQNTETQRINHYQNNLNFKLCFVLFCSLSTNIYTTFKSTNKQRFLERRCVVQNQKNEQIQKISFQVFSKLECGSSSATRSHAVRRTY